MNAAMDPVDPVRTVETMFRILDALQELDGARVSELADHLDKSKSTVHRHLTTLYHHQYVDRRGDEYRVGLRFLTLGEYARQQNEVYHAAQPLVEELAEATEERSLFMTEEHGLAVYLYRGTGQHAVRTNSRVGTRRYLHTIAGGKAILAHLPEPRVNEIIDRWGLPAQTEHTIVERDALFEELERVRQDAVAFNCEECVEGLKAVAAPVMSPEGDVFGALSVSGPAHRLQGEWFESEIPSLLLGTANELELNIEYA